MKKRRQWKVPQPKSAQKKSGPTDEQLEQMEREMPLIYKDLLIESMRLTEQQKPGKRPWKAPTTPEEKDAILLEAGVDVEGGLKKIMASIAAGKEKRRLANLAAGGGLPAGLEEEQIKQDPADGESPKK